MRQKQEKLIGKMLHFLWRDRKFHGIVTDQTRLDYKVVLVDALDSVHIQFQPGDITVIPKKFVKIIPVFVTVLAHW